MIALPNVVQEAEHTCGAAALRAICLHYGTGPDDEARIARDMRLPRAGSDPVHVIRAATRYGLRHREYRGMTTAQLRRCLDRGHPVMLTLQAWGEGHWVVAIGHDRAGITVEDPWRKRTRGRFTYAALDAAWHDVEGPRDTPLVRYGLELWPALRIAAARTPSSRTGRAGRRT